MKGHLKGHGDFRYLREVKVDKIADWEAGAKVGCEIFAEGDYVDVSGPSKGHGFAGVMKRHGFHGGPKTHGQSDRDRAPGSIGSGTSPGRVWKGKRMAGHMGDVRCTTGPLRVLKIDKENDLMVVRGSVPGANGSLVIVKKAKKKG